jgi:hypothetical protein
LATQKQIEAARRNGAKSRGPVTAEGKARSSANALRHGLRSEKLLVLRNESGSGWEDLLAACIRCFEPADEFEAELVHEIAAARWRMRRAWAVETGLFDSQMDKQDTTLRANYRALDEGTRLAAAFTALADETNALNLVTRYETRLRRSFESALDRLEAHRARKQKITERTQPHTSETRPSGSEAGPVDPCA